MSIELALITGRMYLEADIECLTKALEFNEFVVSAKELQSNLRLRTAPDRKGTCTASPAYRIECTCKNKIRQIRPFAELISASPKYTCKMTI